MSVPLLFATRSVLNGCRRRPVNKGWREAAFRSPHGYVFGLLLSMGGAACWSSWTLSACLSLSLWCSFLVLGPAGTGTRFPRHRLLPLPEVFKAPGPFGWSREMAMASSSKLVSLWSGYTVRTVPSVHEVFHLFNEHCRRSPQPLPRRSGAWTHGRTGGNARRRRFRLVSFNAQSERLPRGEDNTERTCQGLGACRDGSPSLPGSSWRLCTPSGVHGHRETCG